MLKIGHRGAPGWPRKAENTVGSFRKALAAGADGFEFDVRRAKSGEIVCIHDSTINRTTNGRGNVGKLSYEEIGRFDAGGGERIPLLSEVLDEFGGKCFLNIELKESGLVPGISAEIKKRGLQNDERIIVSAFDHDDTERGSPSSWQELSLCRETGLRIALLATKKKIRRLEEDRFVGIAKKYSASVINPAINAVTETIISAAHRKNILVCAWTANNPKEIARLKAMNIDGIISDFPELL